jgi:hypothetical protein
MRRQAMRGVKRFAASSDSMTAILWFWFTAGLAEGSPYHKCSTRAVKPFSMIVSDTPL